MCRPNSTRASSPASPSKTTRTPIRTGRCVTWCRNRTNIWHHLWLCSGQPLSTGWLCISSTKTICVSLSRSVSQMTSSQPVETFSMAGAMKSRRVGAANAKTAYSPPSTSFPQKCWPPLKISRFRLSTRATSPPVLTWALMIGS
jgi:hypothetical protein